jgi:uncharacterized caspase-like protein
MLRAAVIFLLITLPAHAWAEARIALLIGNQAYASEIGRLANPHNDVALLETALKAIGFEVVTVRDAGLRNLYQAVNAYARRLQASGSNAVGVFYYSGHGASDGSTNYLIPIDVKTTETGALWDQSLRLNEIIHKLKSEAGNATHFVVFDACRNTLRLTQSGSRALVQSKGFIPVLEENGMLIAYATAKGELASDVGAEAGPYAKALAEEIVKPGIEAVAMFRIVQRRVRAAIRQEPYLGFNALGDIYFGGKSNAAASTASREWQDVKETTSIAVLEQYLQTFKDEVVYAALARDRIDTLKRAQQEKAELEAQAKIKAADARVNAAAEQQRVALLQKQEEEKRRTEAEARAKAEADRQRVALLQKEEEDRKRADAFRPSSTGLDLNAFYDHLMEKVLSSTMGHGSMFNVGRPNNYRNIENPKSLAACIDWTSSTIANPVYHGWNLVGGGDAAQKPVSEEEAARRARINCKKRERTDCVCTTVDINDRNVLQLPNNGRLH